MGAVRERVISAGGVARRAGRPTPTSSHRGSSVSTTHSTPLLRTANEGSKEMYVELRP